MLPFSDLVRIALVVPDLRPESGGPAENVPRLAAALVREGLDVEVHTVGPAPVDADGVAFRAAAEAWPRRLGRSPELLRNLMDSTADVVHANGLWMLPLAYSARAARHKGRPLVVSPRGMLAPWSLARARWKKALAARFVHPGAFTAAAGWHATSRQEAADIERLGLRPVCVAPNGIEPPSEDAAGARAYYRRAAPELAQKRVLLFYSRFHAKKRIRELLADFAPIVRRRPEWHLLAVGIPEEYGVDVLRADAARLGIAGACTVLDGRDAPKPYAIAELMALPTHDENYGRVVAEALARGVPVITTTGTPWQELDAVGAGRWVELASFPAALEALMTRPPAALRAAGEAGRAWVLETFDWSRIAGTLKRFYEGLAA